MQVDSNTEVRLTNDSLSRETSKVEELRCNDVGNSVRFASQHQEHLRYCRSVGWLSFDGKRWKEASDDEVMRLAKLTAKSIYKEAYEEKDRERSWELGKHANRSESEPRLRAMVSLAKSEFGMTVDVKELDTAPHLFNVINGTIDLKTGELQEHKHEDFITKLSPVCYNPNSQAPRFEQFLNEVFGGDVELIKFIQRAIGYSLTGETREQVFFILHGGGENGKSVFINVLLELLNEYAKQTPTETLVQKKAGVMSNDLARLRGARFVSAVETETSHRLAASLLKQMTGEDTIPARFLYREHFEYKPAFKLWLATNHLPQIKDNSHAMWRRIKIIPFDRTFSNEERDSQLFEKLKGELDGILAWCVRGAVEWYAKGLGNSDLVKIATSEYRAEMDTLAPFIQERCETGNHNTVTIAEITQAYYEWCEENDCAPLNKAELSRQLNQRGFKSDKINITAAGERKRTTARVWKGISLRQSEKPHLVAAVA